MSVINPVVNACIFMKFHPLMNIGSGGWGPTAPRLGRDPCQSGNLSERTITFTKISNVELATDCFNHLLYSCRTMTALLNSKSLLATYMNKCYIKCDTFQSKILANAVKIRESVISPSLYIHSSKIQSIATPNWK